MPLVEGRVSALQGGDQLSEQPLSSQPVTV